MNIFILVLCGIFIVSVLHPAVNDQDFCHTVIA